MTSGPSHRLRSAGAVRWAQTTDGSASDGHVDVEDDLALGAVQPASTRSPTCQRASRSQTNVETRPRCSIDSSPAVIPRAAGSSPSASTAAAVNSAKPAVRASAATVPLSSRWARMTSVPGELVATRDAAVDVGAVMDEHLEVEPRRQPTRGAVAAGGRVDAPEPAPEGEVAGLDGIHQERARRPVHPRRTGSRHPPRTSPGGRAGRGDPRSSRAGRRRSPARARARSRR